MSLQVRLRHALGERVLELPEREVSTPLVVGRGREADLQVPSISVSPQHCVLFVHEGQWVVQPMAGVVTLNGEAIAEPAALQIGDILGLGDTASAPLIQIDPIGAAEGRSGPVMAAAVAAPVSRSGLRPTTPTWGAPTPAPAPAPAPAPRQRAYAAPPAPPQMPAAEEAYAEPGAEDGVDWGTANATSDSPSTPRKYAARRKQSSTGPMVAAIVLGGIAFIGLIVYAYNATHRPPPPVVVEQAPPPPPKVVKQPKGLFNIDEDQAAARQTEMQKQSGSATPPPAPDPQPSAPADSTPPPPSSASDPGASAPAPTPAPSTDADTASSKESAAGSDVAWNEIETAHYDIRHLGLSIIKYDEYRRNNPGKNTAELNKYMDEAVNWLYWQRVAQLWKKRDDLTAQIKQKDLDLRNQPPGDFHNQLTQDKAELTKKMSETTDALTNDMAYTSDVPPDLESPTMLEKLAQSRNAEKYEDFKRHILKYVRSNHGAVWWDGES